MPRIKALSLAVALAASTQVQAADLMSITRDAMSNNANYAASRAGYDSTEAQEDVQRGDLLPQITASATHTRYHVISSPDSSAGAATAGGGTAVARGSDDDYGATSANVQLTQSLFDATNWFQLEAAERSTAQQALTLAGDRQQLFYNVAEAYFEVLRAHELLETYRAQERALQREFEQVRQQFEVGVVAIPAVRSAESSYDSARAQRISQESALEVAFESLEQLTGKQYASIDTLKSDLPIERPKPSSRDDWASMAATQNITLLAAKAAVKAARADVKTARAGHLPVVSAFANYDYSKSNQDYIRGHSGDTTFGVQVNVPIFSGGSTSAQVRANTYTLEQTQFQAEDQLRTAVQNARSYYAQVNNAIYSIAAQKKAIASARSSLDARRQGYQVGTYNIVDVLDAEQDFYTAMSNYADARYDYILDMLNLRQAAGVLDQGTLEALNKWLDADKAVQLDISDRSNDQDLLSREISTVDQDSNVFGAVTPARLTPER